MEQTLPQNKNIFTLGITAHSTINIEKFKNMINSIKTAINQCQENPNNVNCKTPPVEILMAIDTVRETERNKQQIQKFNEQLNHLREICKTKHIPFQTIETTDNLKVVGTSRNNIMHLCRTPYFAFLDGDDPITPEAFETVVSAIKENEQLEQPLPTIDLGQGGRSVWNILYKTDKVRQENMSFVKIPNEDGFFLGNLVLGGLTPKKLLNYSGKIMDFDKYKASNSVSYISKTNIFKAILQVFDHFSKHNPGRIDLKYREYNKDDINSYNKTDFTQLLQYFSDVGAFDFVECNSALPLFNRQIDKRKQDNKFEINSILYNDYYLLEKILLALTLYPEILNPDTPECKFFIEANRILKEQQKLIQGDKIDLMGLFKQISIKDTDDKNINWEFILSIIKENFSENLYLYTNNKHNNFDNKKNYFSQLEQNLTSLDFANDPDCDIKLTREELLRILYKQDKSKTLHIYSDPSNVATVIDFPTFTTYDKSDPNRTKRIIKKVLKGEYLPQPTTITESDKPVDMWSIGLMMYNQLTQEQKEEFKELWDCSTMIHDVLTQNQEEVEKLKQRKAELGVCSMLMANKDLPVDQFREFTDLIKETATELNKGQNPEHVERINEMVDRAQLQNEYDNLIQTINTTSKLLPIDYTQIQRV